MGIFNLVRNDFKQAKVRKKYEAVEKAIKDKAKIASDFEYNSTMRKFYDERVEDIDPNVDWWSFAEAKQKQHDHRQSEAHYAAKLSECSARVEACKNSFLAAKRELAANVQ